jgi:hypothetical protein
VRDSSTSEKLWYVVKNVLRSPLSLSLWAAAGVVSFILGWSLIPFGLAGIGQIALLLSRLRDDNYLRKLFIQRLEQQEAETDRLIENVMGTLDFESRQRIRYIMQLQKEIVREARAEDVQSYIRTDLDRISSQLAPLVLRAVQMASKKQHLLRYLFNVDERALRNYCNTLKQRIQATQDEVTRSQYEQALKMRQMELEAYSAIAQAVSRIDSQIENIEATFASWKAKMIRIKTADIASAATVSQGLFQELELLTSDIDLLDNSVTEALAVENETLMRQQTSG